jgi:hypothetical protein
MGSFPVYDLGELMTILRIHGGAPFTVRLAELERARDGALAFLDWFVDTTTRKPLTGESLVLAAILLEVYR